MSSSQLYKGSLSIIILKLLKENGRMYGYEITRKVRELTGGELVINEGALYPSLHKLEAEGYLQVEIEQVGNRLRKYYSVTSRGQDEAVSRVEELAAFIKNMQLLVTPGLVME